MGSTRIHTCSRICLDEKHTKVTPELERDGSVLAASHDLPLWSPGERGLVLSSGWMFQPRRRVDIGMSQTAGRIA